MNEWFKKLLDQTKALWAKWSLVQKIILIGIIVVVIGVIIAVSKISSTPTTYPLFQTAITDENARDDILFRLDQENVEYTLSTTGIISVKDKSTARRLRSLLDQEGLIPDSVPAWDWLGMEQWTTTDFERNINLRNSVVTELQNHLKAQSDISDVNVVISMPEKSTFTADQTPVSASVVITPAPGSDLSINRKKVLAIKKDIRSAVAGLKDENITILDNNGNDLGDFDGMQDFDRISVIEKQQKLIAQLESKYRVEVLSSLQSIFGSDRVRNLNIKIDMDMSEKTIDSTEYKPITIKADNPDTSYDDSELKDSLVLSSETVTKISKGTVYNPEGPAGVEGQNPVVYSDMSNTYTLTEEKGEKVNNVVNSTQTSEIKSPEMGRRTVSVNIDGVWTRNYDDKGNVILGTEGWTFEPVSDEDLTAAISLVQDAVGYDRSRGDSVTVTRIKIDRTAEHEAADEEFRKKERLQSTIIYICIGIAAVLLAFIVFRFISREVERKRRLKEEAILRQHQMEREKTLWEAEQAGMEVTMSIEERERAELQETAIAMAKEHPEDIAMLIRTWLTEE
ncbi:MAG: flagellar M-ring protein FliF [Treponema sp.]|nr:flagellar M-ring protein FliF [Candidatus Treponema caballi]